MQQLMKRADYMHYILNSENLFMTAKKYLRYKPINRDSNSMILKF